MVGTLDDGPCAGLAVCSAGKTANIPHHATQRAIQDTLHISAYPRPSGKSRSGFPVPDERSEEHTSELQSRLHLVCRLLLEKKKEQHVVLLPEMRHGDLYSR